MQTRLHLKGRRSRGVCAGAEAGLRQGRLCFAVPARHRPALHGFHREVIDTAAPPEGGSEAESLPKQCYSDLSREPPGRSPLSLADRRGSRVAFGFDRAAGGS
jgi:hypothetical protein